MENKYSIFYVILAIIICISLYVVLPYYINESWKLGLFITSIASIGAIILAFFLKNEKQKDIKAKLIKEFNYIFSKTALTWILGLWLATFISGIVLLFFGFSKIGSTDINPSAFDIVGIYVSSILGMLAIRAFFETLHPIYDELELIKMITSDLRKVKKKSEIWFSFPAFNLGHFRVETKVVNAVKEIEEYNNALQTIISSGEYSFNGICYSKESIKLLYEKYGEINKGNLKPDHQKLIPTAVTNCTNKATQFVELINTASTHNQNGKYYEMKPDYPIESFIIIGDIVYTIQAWGMPIYRNNQFINPFTDTEQNGEDKKLVKLITYRQNDKELAKTIIQRTKSLINNES